MINFLGLLFLLISQTESFNYLSTCPVPGSPHEVRVYGDYAYIATEQGGLSIVNVSDVENPYLVGSCALCGDGFCLRVVDTIAYVGTSNGFNGLYSINISDPTNPIVIDSVSSITSTYSVVIKNDFAFLAARDIGLFVINISDPSNMFPYGQAYTTYNSTAIDLQGDYVYLASGTFEIFDISNPNSPQRVFCFEAGYPDYATNVVVDDTIAYVTFDEWWENHDSISEEIYDPQSFTQTGAFRVFKVKDPPNSTILDYDHISLDQYGIDCLGNYVIICDLYQGLYLIDVTDPSNIAIEDNYNPGGRCDEVDMKYNYAYVANADLGLMIFQYTEPFDSIPPQIDSTTVWTDTGFAGPYPILTKVTDSNAVDTVLLYYKRVEDVQFHTIPMILQANNWYQGDIPQAYIDDDTIKYYIWARDEFENISTDPDSAPLVYYCFLGRASVGVAEQPWINVNQFSVNWTAVNRSDVVIEMYAPQDINVAIQIFDLTGRLVENQPRLEFRTGIHQFVYTPSHRGLYIVKITAAQQSFCKKLLIL